MLRSLATGAKISQCKHPTSLKSVANVVAQFYAEPEAQAIALEQVGSG